MLINLLVNFHIFGDILVPMIVSIYIIRTKELI
jgi:hypothetical protein